MEVELMIHWVNFLWIELLYHKINYKTQVNGLGCSLDYFQVQVTRNHFQSQVPAEIRHEGGETLRTSFSQDLAKIMVAFVDLYYNTKSKTIESRGSL